MGAQGTTTGGPDLREREDTALLPATPPDVPAVEPVPVEPVPAEPVPPVAPVPLALALAPLPPATAVCPGVAERFRLVG